MTDAAAATARSLIEIARTWATIENEETEVDPRELAIWFASWRNDLPPMEAPEDHPLSLRVSEAVSVDGHGHPADFVDWFIDWRRRVMADLVASGYGTEIAGLPVSVGLATLLFHFEDDLEEAFLREVEAALDSMENGSYAAVVSTVGAVVLDRLIEFVEGIRPSSDLVGRVYRAMALDAARSRRSEYGRYTTS